MIYDGCDTTTLTCGSTNKSFHPNEQWIVQSDPPAIKSALPGNKCLTVNSDDTLSITPCDPAAASQRFTYSSATGAVSTVGENMCVTGPEGAPPTPTSGVISIGRPLKGGTAAVFFLNDNDNATQVSCGAACFAKVGLSPLAKVTVRDLWLGQTVATVTGGFNATIPGGGASSIFVLTPSA